MSKTRLASMDTAGETRVAPEGDAMDTSETVTGKRERAHAEEVMVPDIPAQPQKKRYRAGDLHLAFIGDEEVVEGHAKWWRPESKSRMGTQSRMGAVMSGWVAEERRSHPVQKLAKEKEKFHRDLVSDAKERERSAWKQFEVASSMKDSGQRQDAVDKRWVLPLEVVAGKKTAKAWLGGQYGNCGMRSQPIATAALSNWMMYSLDIKNPVIRADGFSRDAYLCAPQELDSRNAGHIRNPGAADYGLHDGQNYLANPENSSAKKNLRFEISPLGPRLYSVFRKDGGAVGAFTTKIDDVHVQDADFFGGAFSEIGTSGAAPGTCGNRVDAGGQFLGNFDPGTLREELENFPHLPGVMGSRSKTAVGG